VCDDIGVDLLVDDKNDTYWQSDGTQPHLITLQFQQTVEVSRIAVQTDYRMDESYTPQKLSVRIGTRWSDMKVLRTDEVQEPQGWIVIPLGKGSVSGYPGRILQIGILANHQNGRDTHVRQIKVFGPREDVLSSIRSDVRWMTSEATMYATCR
jgi:anaphase-promoting complex subunit 10